MSAREISGGDIRIYDISDSGNVQRVSSITGGSIGAGSVTPHNPLLVGDLLLLSQGSVTGFSLIYDASQTGAVQFADDIDSYTLDVDSGQTLTVLVEPAAGLQPTVERIVKGSVHQACHGDQAQEGYGNQGGGCQTVRLPGLAGRCQNDLIVPHDG
ncbi:MAG: hypothetical protein ACC628_27820 [Pirellulaceae bacterium]